MNTFLSFALVSFVVDILSGSIIVFQGSPATSINGLTKYVTLRCSLNDTAPPSASIIGKRDTSTTTGNVEQVSSIIIMHNNVDIASVAQSHSAKSMVAASNMDVSGDVSGKTGERGFLEVKLHFPAPVQLGEFDCEVVATKPNGHGAIFNINTGTNFTQPTIMDSVLYTRDVEHEKDLLVARTDSLEKERDAAKQRLTSVEARNTALESENAAAKQRLTVLESEVAALTAYTRKPPTLSNCHTTGFLNNFDDEVNYHAPGGAVIVGEHSYHDNHSEDRRFRFTYCYLHAP